MKLIVRSREDKRWRRRLVKVLLVTLNVKEVKLELFETF